MTKFEALKEQYCLAFKGFKQVLKKEKTDVIRDAAIRRFELTLDRSWRLIKAYLEEKKGIRCVSPKDCFREAYRQGLIDYDELWLKMIDSRNKITSTYSEKLADALYKKLPSILKRFQTLEKNIKEY